MMKKVLLAGAVSAVALTSVVQAKVERSPYIGLGLGAVGFRNTININENAVTSHNPNSNKQAAAIGLILGYGVNVDSFHIGAELDYYYNTSTRAKSDVNVPNGYATGVSSNGSFGAALRLGYWLSQNHLIYLRGGVEVRRFDFNVDRQGANALPSVSSHDTRLAFTPGLGFEMKLNDNLSLNLEARTAYYSSKERSATNVAGTTRGKYRPHVDSALLSVRYKIGPLFS